MKYFFIACLTLTFAAATAWAGRIDLGAPLVSGEVSVVDARQGPHATTLSHEQLQKVSRWFETQTSGWQGMITPASTEPVKLEVRLTHGDGRLTTICVIARMNGGQYLRLTGPGVMAYRSWGGLFQSWAAIRPLSDPEAAALEALIGVPVRRLSAT